MVGKSSRTKSFGSNKFYGSDWDCFKINSCFPKLKIFDISNNKFNGFLPASHFNGKTDVGEADKKLNYIGEQYYQDSVMVTWKGLEIQLVKIITIFTTIDFSSNNFRGEIPEVIGKFHALCLLNLSQNNLTDCIPSSLGNLIALETLDLSSNKLAGKIPWQLTRLNFLQVLNLSTNQLSGPIPKDNHFDTFPNNSYGGNLALCGFPLPNKCGIDSETQQPPSTSEDDASLEIRGGGGPCRAMPEFLQPTVPWAVSCHGPQKFVLCHAKQSKWTAHGPVGRAVPLWTSSRAFVGRLRRHDI